MASLINIQIIGNIGKSAETRQVGDYTVISFSLGVNDTFTKDGQRQERTTWFRVNHWVREDKVSQYLTKGKQVCVVADRISANAYEGQNGLQASIDITATRLVLLGTREDGQAANAQPQQVRAPRRPAPQRQTLPPVNSPEYFTENPDDMPF